MGIGKDINVNIDFLLWTVVLVVLVVLVVTEDNSNVAVDNDNDASDTDSSCCTTDNDGAADTIVSGFGFLREKPLLAVDGCYCCCFCEVRCTFLLLLVVMPQLLPRILSLNNSDGDTLIPPNGSQ